MKGLAVLFFIGFIGFIYCKPGDTYTNKYDNINIDTLIGNARLFDPQVLCLEGTGKCSKEGEELKRNLPDALQNDCSKCTEAQKTGSRKVIRHLIKNRPDDWAKLQQKYDPNNIYVTKYDDELKKA